MAEVDKDTEEKIGQLQMLEQSMQNFLAQKQQFQSQLTEVLSALEELKTAKTAYKIVGNIMVAASKEELEKDLNEKKETLTLRIETIEKQESKLREKASGLQSEVMEKLKK